MINELYRAIASGLAAVRPCTIYREDVPQNFKRPCFVVTLYDQNPSRGINGRFKNSVNADILYFPEDESDAGSHEECWTVGQDLEREFRPPGFKIRNRSLRITDKVLHFLFRVDYREILVSTDVKMKEMTQSLEQKGE